MNDKLEQACQLLGDWVYKSHDKVWRWNEYRNRLSTPVELDGLVAFALFDVVATWPPENQDDFDQWLSEKIDWEPRFQDFPHLHKLKVDHS